MKASVEKLSVADLKAVLPGLSKVVSRKSSLPILGCVKVIHAADHSIRLHADNLDEAVTVRLQNPSPGVPGEMLVPLEELATLAKRCGAEETIEVRDTGKETRLVYCAGGALIEKPVGHFGLEEFPPAREVTAEPLSLDDAFKTAIKEAFECASTESSRYVLNGACLDVESSKQAHYVVGTDGRQLYSANSFLFDLPSSLIIPNRKFIQWQGFQDDGPWTLRFQPEIKAEPKAKIAGRLPYVRLDSDHWTYVAKPIEGNYPNWKQVVPAKEGPSKIVLDQSGVKTILEALPLLPGGDQHNEPVSLEIRGHDLILKARTSEKASWSQVPVPATVSGIPVDFHINRTYLAKCLRFGCTEIVIESPLAPVVFKGKGKTMVICPLNPNPPEAAAKTVNNQPPTAAAPAAAPAQPPAPASVAPTSPTENVSAAAPSPVETTVPTANERNTTVSQNTTTAPPRTTNTGAAPEASALDEMTKQIGLVRDGVKKVLEDLSTAERLLRQAQKESKATEKEIGKARSTLRSLQSVEI